MKTNLRRDSVQDAPFDIILWYVLKNNYLLQEYNQFLIKRSYVFFDTFLLFVHLIEDKSRYYKINIRYTFSSIVLECHLITMFLVFWYRHKNNACFVGIDLALSPKTNSAGHSDQSVVVCNIYQAPNIGSITGDRRLYWARY